MLPGDEEREMLRQSLRRLLERLWPTERAVALAADRQAVASIWRALAEQGVASLGRDPLEGGLREIVVALEELGRAGCPAPLIGAALANMALSPLRNSSQEAAALLDALHQGDAAVAFALGSFDGDPRAGALQWIDGQLQGCVDFVEGTGFANPRLAGACSGAPMSLKEFAKVYEQREFDVRISLPKSVVALFMAPQA
jgi:hypothetical protein